MAENIQIKIDAAVESAQAAQTIGQLRKSLQDLQALAEESDLGSEQFQKLQQQILQTNASLAASKDRLGDIQDKISTLEGTPVERLKNSFELLKQSIFTLDFDKAKIGVQGLVNAFTPLGPDGAPLKGLAALKGTIAGLGSSVAGLGQTFIQLGRALLTNPLFLLATVVTTIVVAIVALLNKLGLLKPIFDAIGDAVEFVTSLFNQFTEAIGLNTAATEENLKKTTEAEAEKRKEYEKSLAVQEKIASSVEGLNSRQIASIRKLTGVYVSDSSSIENVRLETTKKLIASYDRDLAKYAELIDKKGKLNDEEQKNYDDLVSKATEANLKLVEITANRYKKVFTCAKHRKIY
jgi:hypothetical protein